MPKVRNKPRHIIVEVPKERDRYSPPSVEYPVTKDELLYLYYDEQKSIREIAKELGRGATTIRRWMDIYNIERRGYSQATITHYRKLRGENNDTIEN
jgi:transposase-like protein